VLSNTRCSTACVDEEMALTRLVFNLPGNAGIEIRNGKRLHPVTRGKATASGFISWTSPSDSAAFGRRQRASRRVWAHRRGSPDSACILSISSSAEDECARIRARRLWQRSSPPGAEGLQAAPQRSGAGNGFFPNRPEVCTERCLVPKACLPGAAPGTSTEATGCWLGVVRAPLSTLVPGERPVSSRLVIDFPHSRVAKTVRQYADFAWAGRKL